MLVEPKLLHFCQNLLLGMPKQQAARQAGVSGPDRLLKRPEVQQYLAEQQARAQNTFEVTRDQVLKGFITAAEMAETLEDPTGMVQAFREVGRLLGYYEPETKRVILSTAQEERQRQLESMNEADLLALAGTTAVGRVVDAEFTLIDSEPTIN